jgi:hypothetical protein
VCRRVHLRPCCQWAVDAEGMRAVPCAQARQHVTPAGSRVHVRVWSGAQNWGDGRIESRVHAAALCCAAGDKWSMQQFIRVGQFRERGRGGRPTHQTVNPAPVLPYVDCPDQGKDCKGMSIAQCHPQRDTLIGNVTHPGSCLSRCMRCDIWREHLKLQAREERMEGAPSHPRT